MDGKARACRQPEAPASGDAPAGDAPLPTAGLPRLSRAQAWAGLRTGDPVRVGGAHQRAATWTFVAHVRNTRTGEEWVEVAGGRPGNHAVRSFRPDQIFPPSPAGRGATRSAGPSLAEAPRLPL